MLALSASALALLLQISFALSPISAALQVAVAAAQTTSSVSSQARPVFNRAGTRLAFADTEGFIGILDLDSGQVSPVAADGIAEVRALAFSPDDRVLASARHNTISLWGLAEKAVLRLLEAEPERRVERIAFSNDGGRVAAVLDDGAVAVWDLGGTAAPAGFVNDIPTTRVAFSPDGRYLTAFGSGVQVTVWDLENRREHLRLANPTDAAITDLAFSPGGATLASADAAGEVSLWDSGFRYRQSLRGHAGPVARLGFSPDGETLASDGTDARILLWDVVSGENRAALYGGSATKVAGLAFSPDGNKLASVGETGEILIWDVPTGSLLQVLPVRSTLAEALAFGASGETLASLDADGQVVVWDLGSGTERSIWPTAQSADSAKPVPEASSLAIQPALIRVSATTAAETATDATQVATDTQIAPARIAAVAVTEPQAITSIAAAPDGSGMASTSEDGGMRTWSTTYEAQMARAAHPSTAATGVAFSADSKQLFTVGRDTRVCRWDRSSGTLLQVMLAHEQPVRTTAASRQGDLLATAGEETRVMLWNAKTGKLARILSGHKGFVNALAFSPNGKELATAGADRRVIRWAVGNGTLTDALLGHSEAVTSVAYSTNGALLASGSRDTTVKVWDTKTGKQLNSLSQSAPVLAVAFSTNGKYLASAGESTQIYIWDVSAGGKLSTVIDAGKGFVTALAYLNDGRLVAGGADGSMTTWDVEASRQPEIQMMPAPLSQGLPPANAPDGPMPIGAGTAPIASRSARDASGNALAALAQRLLDWIVPPAGAQALPDPNQGPGGPILVIVDDSSPRALFGAYYAEILRTEGFNAFTVADIDTISAGTLADYDLAILAPVELSPGDVTMLTSWVNGGRKLIAMRPDPQLAGLLGLASTGTTLSEGYLLVDSSAAPGAGIVAETMQFHGTADRYTLAGAEVVATLYSSASTGTANPAVTLRGVGTQGGQAAAFAFDLATSIVYTRQGNPAWANQERDGFAPQRSDDKYFGNAVGDPQPDWVDLNKVAIPQADEQQRLLANLIVHLTRDRKPLPRFWYFPRGEKAVVIMTGDDHGNNGTTGRWNQFLSLSPAGCSVADWECVRGTSYMYPRTPMTNAQAAAFEAQGFEVGLHIDTGCANYSLATLRTDYTQQIAEFVQKWPNVPPPTTQRHHCIAWTDWATGAKVQLENGVRLDTSYYYWPPAWIDDRPGMFNGSAMPMRFADLDGSLIDVYQAATQLTDESGQTYPFTVNALLDRAIGPEGYYGAYTINAHTDADVIQESTDAVSSALTRGVPVVTSRQMLRWLDGRNSSKLTQIAWNGQTLSFAVELPVAAGMDTNGLQVLVPMQTPGGVVTAVARGATTVPHEVVARKGIEYAAFAATAGSYTVTYGADTAPPTVVSVAPQDQATGVGLGATVSATFSEQIDPATLTASSFTLRPGNGAPIAAQIGYQADSRTATLNPSAPLAPETLYTATLTTGIADAFGTPLPQQVVWSFTTQPALSCPCTVWSPSTTPANPSANDPNAVELGVKLRSDVDGFITGIRFYKGPGNTGTHLGRLWTQNGTQLGTTATFTNETASGWQQVNFDSPIPIAAGTVYVASYYAPNGGYAFNAPFFGSGGVDNPPLHLLADGESGGNGVYRYGSGGGFPDQTWNSSNYWVDAVFVPASPDPGGDTTPPQVTSVTPAEGATGVVLGTAVTAAFNEAMAPATFTATSFELRGPGNTAVPATLTYSSVNRTASLTPNAPLAAGTAYTATLRGGTSGVTDLAGNPLAANRVWSFTTAPAGGGVCTAPCSLWDNTATPAVLTDPDTDAVELGVKFRSNTGGYITGIRFYKGPQNTGTHTGSLWSASGTLLAQVTFTNESASGWQEASFSGPVAIEADTLYVASYHTQVGRYSVDTGYFGSARANGPLTAPASSDAGVNGNGVYLYGPGGFPSNTFGASNYWVDVLFTTVTGPDTTPPTVTARTPANGAANVPTGTGVTATFSEPMSAASLTSATFELRNGTNQLVSADVGYAAASRTATLTPTAPLALNATYTATVKGGSSGAKDAAGNALASDESWTFATAASDPCVTGNPVVRENCLPGSPRSEWDIVQPGQEPSAGDASIQGFATDISVNRGGTIDFKIDTTSTDYRLDIYRMGYYQGNGARLVATVLPSAPLPQNQPNCSVQASTGLLDCGNWAVSATWAVPASATSGIYIAKAIREDTGGASHIVFVVRDDTGGSDILFQTADTTWQAYNRYGNNGLYNGNSLYAGNGPGSGGASDGRAYKVSYNRPFSTRGIDGGQDWLFNAEYPMVRWLEANGYDVSYFTGVDSHRFGAEIQEHNVFLSVGHDEYWSGEQRSNVEAARSAGVHLAFFSGNEVFWKTRWEVAVAGPGDPFRTMVCYKETHDFPNNPDPLDPPVWTGTWRDPRNSPPADGNRPENALTGTIFTVNAGATTNIRVPAADGRMRFWRNTSIASLASGQTATLAPGTLGYEWDEDLDNGFRPDGLIRLSTTTVTDAPVLTDYGSSFGSGTATHHLTLYRHPSASPGGSALVFGAGTVQWSWGLDSNHDRGNAPADLDMQQATVNLLADMNVTPATLQPGLTPATASTDTTAPTSAIASPASGSNLATGSPATVTGTAADTGGGVVGGVEVSVDGGATWHPANGRESWSYTWIPLSSGSLTLRSRAIDDSGNIEAPGPAVVVTVGTGGDTQPPTSPGGLTAVPTSASAIDLSWGAASDNVAVAGYRVERCSGAGCTGFSQIAAPAGLAHSDTGLAAATLYRYRVRAVDAQNNLGPYSNIAEATTQTPPPASVSLYFSTLGNSLPPDAGGTADDADIYVRTGSAFSRVLDASAVGVPAGANVDGLSVLNGIFYVSFVGNVTIAGQSYQDEDILAYNPATDAWSLHFDGTAPGLTATNHDIDAFDISGSVLYFSTSGTTNPPGVTGTADDADVYSWNGATFARVLDLSTRGVPGAANLDGLTVRGGVYYLSFVADHTIAGVTYQDEDVLAYDSGTNTWSLYFDGTTPGLGSAAGLDIDALQVP